MIRHNMRRRGTERRIGKRTPAPLEKCEHPREHLGASRGLSRSLIYCTLCGAEVELKHTQLQSAAIYGDVRMFKPAPTLRPKNRGKVGP